ncbi:MAG TPA: phage terminase large subunit [Terriglobales bacterium]|jgi:predicted phage terminase large subunit-like protein|nr:phage terminase large subunit [Terriglobales bacterium]
MKSTTSKYHALLRSDFNAFIERSFHELNPTTAFLSNWHIEKIAAELEACRRGETKRLIINVPPRSLKSHCTSIAFPAWVLGHDPSAQIIAASYAQELANKLSGDCRALFYSSFYQDLFSTRLSPQRQAVEEFVTTRQGFRLSTSTGGVLTGRGANFIIIDDPLKPDDAFSDTQRKAVNDWFDQTLYSRLSNKTNGCIILIMQRLHEDDLVGHVLGVEPWKVIRFPAIAEEDETHLTQSPYGTRRFQRCAGEALHPEREPLEVLKHVREVPGEYNFGGQYQQAPTPLGGGMVKAEWFKIYTEASLPATFEMTFQSWDTANKPAELSDYSVCTTWGVKEKHAYLLHVVRKRLGYPELKRVVREHAEAFSPQTILIEDKASGTQLIQELVSEGVHAIQKYEPTMDKVMRMHSVTSTIENGFLHFPDKASWLPEYRHELTSFPKGEYDDQADSTSQALDWFKQQYMNSIQPSIECIKLEDDGFDSPLTNRSALLRESNRTRIASFARY